MCQHVVLTSCLTDYEIAELRALGRLDVDPDTGIGRVRLDGQMLHRLLHSRLTHLVRVVAERDEAQRQLDAIRKGRN